MFTLDDDMSGLDLFDSDILMEPEPAADAVSALPQNPSGSSSDGDFVKLLRAVLGFVGDEIVQSGLLVLVYGIGTVVGIDEILCQTCEIGKVPEREDLDHIVTCGVVFGLWTVFHAKCF